jgi:NADH:ubiquinone reductase (H+-translocating)
MLRGVAKALQEATGPHVVVVGGGFGGINATKELLRRGPKDLRITIVDRRNHHLFQPLLYQVAMAGLSPADITMPIRAIFKGERRVAVRLGTVIDVDPHERCVVTDTGDLRYDYLVLAAGATHAYFGHDEWEQHAPGLKTVEQATEIRRRVLTAFERAEIEPDLAEKRRLLTFVVVGGGPTGVELAGALGELSRHTLVRDFRSIDPSATRVILIEGGDRILPAFDPELSAAAVRSLERLGVTVWTSTRVTEIDANGVQAGEERVRAGTVLWAAGVRSSSLGDALGASTDAAGRVEVNPDLSVPGHPEVFVIGDMARMLDDGELVPGVAPAAIQEGVHAARNIVADIVGGKREPFQYWDKGMMATIGRASGVMQTGHLKWSGFLAWLAWCFVHILYLIGFRNRVLVFVQWVWSYINYRRGARLITEHEWRLAPEASQAALPQSSASTTSALAEAPPHAVPRQSSQA